MKKTLIAAALLAGFAGAAYAQNTSVTLYGIIDIGLGYNKVKAPKAVAGTNKSSASRIGMLSGVQNGSRWGLRGTEDLGDGLRAVFQLESGFDSRSGTHGQGGRLFGRHATLGLAGDSWGQLDFGRQTNMASKYFGDIDPMAAAFTQSNLGHGIGSVNTRRLSNMVLYRTPDIEGFQAGVGYSFNANNENEGGAGFRTKNKVRSWTTGLRYVNGPLNVAASYDQAQNTGAAGVPNRNQKIKVYALGATYDFEVVKVATAFGRTSGGWMNGQNAEGGPAVGLLDANAFGAGAEKFAKGFRANSYMLGLSAPLGEGSKIFASWQHIKPKNEKLTGFTGANKNDETSNVYSVGYTYDFSRRTGLYSYLSHATDYAFHDGVKSTAMGVGLRHRF